jgi:putative transposase
MNPLAWSRKHLDDEGGSDLIREMIKAFAESVMSSLVARGLSSVQLVVSDAHEGLEGAIAAVLEGATWQRCRTHAMRNLLSTVPRSAQPVVATLVRTVFAQPDSESTWAQLERVVDRPQGRFSAAPTAPRHRGCDLVARAGTSWRRRPGCSSPT